MTINADTLSQIIRAAGIPAHQLHKEWDTSARVAEQWLSSKHPPLKAERTGRQALRHMAVVTAHLQQTIRNAPAGILLIRSFHQDDDLSDIVEHPWSGAQHNTSIQHLLLMDAIDHLERRADTHLMVIADSVWPDDNDELTLALAPNTPVFAVAHRFPEVASIDLCVPRLGEDDPRPGVEAAEDVTAVDTLYPTLPLDENDVGGTGLWSAKASGRLLDASGFIQTEDWRLSGHGHPIASTTILPAGLDPYRLADGAEHSTTPAQ